MVKTRRQLQEEEMMRRSKIAILTTDYVSNEITTEILSRVPVEDLLRFKCACKCWNTLLKDPFFIKLHLHQHIRNNNSFLIYNCTGKIYSVDYDILSLSFNLNRAVMVNCPIQLKPKSEDFTIYGSCNGILLIGVLNRFTDEYKRICLWNPSTRECKNLCPPLAREHNDYSSLVYCLGYDISTDDYKVIRYRYDESHCKISDVCVYSMRSNSWKRIQDVPYNIYNADGVIDGSFNGRYGMLLNGVIHWLGMYASVTSYSQRIVSFDLAKDEFSDLQLRGIVRETGSRIWKQLGVFEECLCIYLVNKKNNKIDLFMMKEYGVEESWTKMFTISDQLIQNMLNFQVICITQDRKVLVQWNNNDGDLFNNDLALHDPKHGWCKCGDIKIQGLPKRFWRSGIVTYVKSLVTINLIE
ncbi:hypothetical protein AQUCO_01300767v1 [Aquilegia coerulea]|uniref:F-box domain-containing protein n=1 Tax=Aquilegia coerulea TaxID=218851 RepID=A0A2G5E386_AQUCA|nr:hypothetical protein AQUCO_01300767v1 [Aquilegia coerulea]